MNSNEFSQCLDVILNPAAPERSRWAFVKSFENFALSYISGLQGVLDNLPENDPIYQEVQDSLDAITHKLMDT